MIHYSTSGANEIIFICPLFLNSLVTGPKILVPIGSPLWISDVMLNDDRTGPLFGAMFALNMRVLAHDGRCHSVAEQSLWLQELGFDIIDTHHLPPPINYTLIHAQKVR